MGSVDPPFVLQTPCTDEQVAPKNDLLEPNAFGNALGNAAITGIEQENAVSEQHQARSARSLLSADNSNSAVNPVAAFLSGPYANMGDGVSDAEIAAYESSGLPVLASIGAAATYAAVNGGGQEPVDVTTPAFLADSQTGALSQLDYDAQWMNYANAVAQQPGGVADAASIKAAQAAYNAAANSDTVTNGGQYDPAKVQALDDALNDMIDANGWSFGPVGSAAGDQITTLPTITVTPSADELAQAGVTTASTFTFADAGEIGDIVDDSSFGLGILDIADRGAAQFGALGILNRAGTLQQDRMSEIAKSTSFEELKGILSDTSKSGQWISKFGAVSEKVIAPLGVAADAVSLAVDIKQAQPGQVPLVIAQDTTSFAAELGATVAGAEFGAVVLGPTFAPMTGPFAPFTEAALSVAGGLVGFSAYNLPIAKNGVKNYVSTLVNGVDSVIENPHIIVDDIKSQWNHIKSDAMSAQAYLEYLSLPGPKGPYQP